MSKPTSSNGRLQWRELLSLGERLLNLTSIDAQKKVIVQSIERLLGCQADLYIQDQPIWRNATPRTRQNTPLSLQMAMVLERGKPVLNNKAPGSVVSPAVVAVPVKTRRDMMGVLQVQRTSGLCFSKEEIDFIKGLAGQSAIALQHTRQAEMDRWKADLINLVREVGSQIVELLDLDELAHRVTRLILDTFRYYYVAVFTLEGDQHSLCYRASAGPLTNQASAHSPALTVEYGLGIIGHVAQSGQEVLANNVSEYPFYRRADALPETRAEFALPLRVGDRILGVLDVQSDYCDAFTEMDILVLRSLADNIASALENTRLYSSLRKQTNQLLSVAEVGNALTSILDLDNLLNNVVNLVHKRFGYPYVYIFTVHHGVGKIVFRAGSNVQQINGEDISFDLQAPKGLVPWAARHAETAITNVALADERYAPSPLPPDDTKSELVVPLTFGGHVLGVLDIQSSQQNAFGPEDILLFESLADSIAVGMRNANLYRSEQWRRQVAESMREVAGLLSTDAALDVVLDRILEELESTLPCDAAAIWLVDDASSGTGIDQLISTLHLSAVRENINGDPPDRTPLSALMEQYQLPASDSPWLSNALGAASPSVRTTADPYEPIGAILEFPADYSAIAAPLRIGEQILGILTMVHHTPGRYGSESRAMTAAFASYAAVAIENTRLYEAAHDQAWVSTVLLQVAEATQSLTSRQELLNTVVHTIPELVGVRSCAILLWDKASETFIPTVAYGLSPEQQESFASWNITTNGQFNVFDALVKGKKSILLNSQALPPNQAQFSGFNLDHDLLAMIPMIAQGDVSGIVFVDFTDAGSCYDDATCDLWEEKLTIIQGIAHQTAIAAENIRLLEAQEEEAYISVALLQVAQAVVSSQDLSEILTAIVRITPILVGVKRCAIFLWDTDKQVFHLSATYGISKNDLDILESAHHPQDFLLLGTIKSENSLTYHVITDDVETSPLDWQNLDQESICVVPNLSTPDVADQSREFLRNKDRLLLGFPLSVKGNILGVMLIEEENAYGGAPSAYIRLKRLEIVTGITQQAALAVQNDLLQREVVERGRLEREMQLAREIQQTFLPDHLPELPGWELAIRWQPARQVGGDFYDIIDLPDERLGLVIADVADKGMPAALFMTLIRTLIRAAVQNEQSPARVLQQVNDLLVPDAKHGMFVTVVYAVLNPQTRCLIYANAGHNPPLLYRHNSQILEELKRTGMALGVFEGVDISEREIVLESEDSIIFYTDGVTEACSSEEEFYGTERLQHTILSLKHITADGLARAIDNSIKEFIEDAVPFDDLTIVALLKQP